VCHRFPREGGFQIGHCLDLGSLNFVLLVWLIGAVRCPRTQFRLPPHINPIDCFNQSDLLCKSLRPQ
jgi:hypothetical protein